MVRQGALDNPKVDAIFGLHVTSRFAAGEVTYRPEGMLAAVDTLTPPARCTAAKIRPRPAGSMAPRYAEMERSLARAKARHHLDTEVAVRHLGPQLARKDGVPAVARPVVIAVEQIGPALSPSGEDPIARSFYQEATSTKPQSAPLRRPDIVNSLHRRTYGVA